MAQLRELSPHDPLPDGGRYVTVLQRFDEDNPKRVIVEIAFSDGHGLRETTHPAHPGGRAMTFREAIDAALAVADSEGVAEVQAVDRTAGPLEHKILEQGGIHAVPDPLSDDDLEEGERGPDMRRP